MFGKQTLFIIGAGASAELELPLGYKLAKIIQENTRTFQIRGGLIEGPGTNLMIALGQHSKGAYTDHKLLTAARILNRGVTYNASIDDFLSVHAHSNVIVEMGKLAIIQAILDAERASKLASLIDGKQVLDTSSLEDTWLLQLSQILIRGHTQETVESIFDNVAFVTFNYDRSLEIFLIHALKDGFAIPFETACRIVKSATIIHVYGDVGKLPGTAPDRTLDFGGDGYPLRQVASIGLIQTYGESAADAKPIHEEIQKAEQIVFLGFAFHPQNMKLLKTEASLSAKTFIATTYGMSELDVKLAGNELWSFFDPFTQADLNNSAEPFFHPNAVKCAELMARYALSLGQT